MKWDNPIWLWTDASLISHDGLGPAGYGYVIRLNDQEYYIGSGELAPSYNMILLELKSILLGIKAVNHVLIEKHITDRMILVHNDSTEVSRVIMGQTHKDIYKTTIYELYEYINVFGPKLCFVYHRKYYFKSNKHHHLAHVLAFSAARHNATICKRIDSDIPDDASRWLWEQIKTDGVVAPRGVEPRSSD